MKNAGINRLMVLVFLLGWCWSPAQVVFAQDGGATGGIFEVYEVQPGERVEVPIEIQAVEDLYAVDFEIQFDPNVVQVEDANPNVNDVQPALGTFLDAGLALYNTVDNEAGVVRFAMTQANPSEAKSGSGVVLILYFQGIAEGESDLTVTTMELATRSGEAISVETVSSTITVSAEAVARAATAIPVQDPALMVAIPTLQPTEIPPTATPMEAPGEEEKADPDAASAQGTEDEEFEASDPARMEAGFSLLDHWWIVAIVVILVVGFAVYLLTNKK